MIEERILWDHHHHHPAKTRIRFFILLKDWISLYNCYRFFWKYFDFLNPLHQHFSCPTCFLLSSFSRNITKSHYKQFLFTVSFFNLPIICLIPLRNLQGSSFKRGKYIILGVFYTLLVREGIPFYDFSSKFCFFNLCVLSGIKNQRLV